MTSHVPHRDLHQARILSEARRLGREARAARDIPPPEPPPSAQAIADRVRRMVPVLRQTTESDFDWLWRSIKRERTRRLAATGPVGGGR